MLTENNNVCIVHIIVISVFITVNYCYIVHGNRRSIYMYIGYWILNKYYY